MIMYVYIFIRVCVHEFICIGLCECIGYVFCTHAYGICIYIYILYVCIYAHIIYAHIIYAHIIYAATHRCIIYAYMKGIYVCVMLRHIFSSS